MKSGSNSSNKANKQIFEARNVKEIKLPFNENGLRLVFT